MTNAKTLGKNRKASVDGMPDSKNLRGLVRRGLGKLIYQQTVDSDGCPLPQKPVVGRLNQFCIEHGWTMPYIWTQEECEHYWARRTNSSQSNTPEGYAKKDTRIMDFLTSFWRPDIDEESSILELGSNCGVNLDHLMRNGYRQLSGVEINPVAVESVPELFPELAARSSINLGSLKQVLPDLPSKSVDVVFTMAVAQHIHPRSNFLFYEMVRLARKYVCILELEAANTSHIFSRNYQRVFNNLGGREVRSTVLDSSAYPSVGESHYGYTARLVDVSPAIAMAA